jgi:hypothetical protein
LQGGTREIRKVYFEHFPVPKASTRQSELLSDLASERIRLTSELKSHVTKFQRSMQRKFNIEALSGQLESWYLLGYKAFITELGKKKVKLSLKEEAEWEAYFLEEATHALAIKSEIEKTDHEIDRMVNELYGVEQE